MIIAYIFLWLTLCALGVSYGLMVRKTYASTSEPEMEICAALATCFIFYGDHQHVYMRDIIYDCESACLNAGLKIASQKFHGGARDVQFDDGTRVLVYAADSALRPPEDINLLDYNLQLFVDSKLPATAALNLVEGLGLRRYVVKLGFIGEDYGE